MNFSSRRLKKCLLAILCLKNIQWVWLQFVNHQADLVPSGSFVLSPNPPQPPFGQKRFATRTTIDQLLYDGSYFLFFFLWFLCDYFYMIQQCIARLWGQANSCCLSMHQSDFNMVSKCNHGYKGILVYLHGGLYKMYAHFSLCRC